MQILVVSNLYPPHHAGGFDLRCQEVTEALQRRGHVLRVLTSNHGVGTEQRGADIERRLRLQGVFEHPASSGFRELRELEFQNHALLRATVNEFKPDLIHVWSLHGLSKSLVLALRDLRLPVVYDVSDDWLAEGLRHDLWLRWWNCPAAPALAGLHRRFLEFTGGRKRIDAFAPTRIMPGYDRIPELYGEVSTSAPHQPSLLSAFRFQRLYFCSQALKRRAERAGFQVQQAEVIYPGIRAELFAGAVKPESAPLKRLLVVSRLSPEAGIMTAIEALREVRRERLPVSLSIYGRGESDYMAQLRSFAVQQQLPIEFLSVSNLNRDLASVYRQHDAFLHTAQWEEPFASTPLEAMASGLPVIGARSGGIQEIFRHGENALTFAPGDAAELAAHIHTLCRQPGLRCALAETAQAEVLSKFNETVVVDQIEHYLNASRQLWQQE